MKAYEYYTQGVCSRQIHVEIDDDGRIAEAYFIAGCPGNTQGVCSLIKGMKVEEVISRLKGITCGNKTTSCPDQLATMLEKILENA